MITSLEEKLKLKTEAYNALLENYKGLQLRVERQRGQTYSEQPEDQEHARLTIAERRKIIEANRKFKEEIQKLNQALQNEKENHQDFITTSQELHERQKKEITEAKDQIINNLKEKNQQLSNLISPNQPYNFTQLHQELKRLKIQDLTVQIPLKKQELEQNTNNLKNNLNNSGKYLLDKLLKKQKKLFQSNETNSGKLNELKQTLSGDLGDNFEKLQVLLNQQKEIFSLEKHLENLQNEQVAQIIHNPVMNN